MYGSDVWIGFCPRQPPPDFQRLLSSCPYFTDLILFVSVLQTLSVWDLCAFNSIICLLQMRRSFQSFKSGSLTSLSVRHWLPEGTVLPPNAWFAAGPMIDNRERQLR